MSFDTKPEGAISNEQIHTPMSHAMEISADDFRRMILIMSGMFHSGIAIDATNPTCSIKVIPLP